MKNNKKRVLLLGGSSDIGIEVAKIFLSQNWNVDLHFFKNKKNVSKLKYYSNKLKIIQIDFNNNNLNFEKNLKKKINNDYDAVVNLIGFVDNKSFEKTTLRDFLKSLKINTIFPLLIEKILLKKMLVRKWGRILNCSSIGVKYGGGKNTFNYSFSKHALEFIPSDYKNWAKRNVLINNIRIGVTDTKIHKRIKHKNLKKRINLIPMGRMAKSDEIAKFIFQLASQKNTFITGETLSIAGGE